MSDENEPQKLGLTSKREVPLSMYVYIIREGYNNVVATPQNVSFIMAYTNDDALNTVRTQYPAGKELTIEQKGQISFQSIMDMFQKTIDLKGTEVMTPVKQEPEIIARTKKDFYKEIVEGMLKDVEPFCRAPEDVEPVTSALNKMLDLVS